MPRQKLIDRHESVAVVQRGNRLALRYQSSGAWRLKSCKTTDVEFALKQARELHESILRDEQIERDTELGRIPIDHAIARGIKQARGQSARHQEIMTYNGERVCKWLADNFPEVAYWHELKQSIIFAFIDEQLEKKLRPQTIKLLLNPIRLAQNWVLRVEPDNYKPMLFSHPQLVDTRKAKRYTDREQMNALLDIFRARQLRRQEIFVLLCGFCGLRISEVVRLERHNIDVQRKLIILTDQTVKTQHSSRVIPAPQWVLERVVEIVPATGLLMHSDSGEPIHEDEVGHNYLRPYLDKVPGQRITARNLRTTFANMAIDASVGSDELRAYMGHRPKSILEESYANFCRPELLRERVVDRIEAHFNNAKAAVLPIHGTNGGTDSDREAREQHA